MSAQSMYEKMWIFAYLLEPDAVYERRDYTGVFDFSNNYTYYTGWDYFESYFSPVGNTKNFKEPGTPVFGKANYHAGIDVDDFKTTIPGPYQFAFKYDADKDAYVLDPAQRDALIAAVQANKDKYDDTYLKKKVPAVYLNTHNFENEDERIKFGNKLLAVSADPDYTSTVPIEFAYNTDVKHSISFASEDAQTAGRALIVDKNKDNAAFTKNEWNNMKNVGSTDPNVVNYASYDDYVISTVAAPVRSYSAPTTSSQPAPTTTPTSDASGTSTTSGTTSYGNTASSAGIPVAQPPAQGIEHVSPESRAVGIASGTISDDERRKDLIRRATLRTGINPTNIGTPTVTELEDGTSQITFHSAAQLAYFTGFVSEEAIDEALAQANARGLSDEDLYLVAPSSSWNPNRHLYIDENKNANNLSAQQWINGTNTNAPSFTTQAQGLGTSGAPTTLYDWQQYTKNINK